MKKIFIFFVLSAVFFFAGCRNNDFEIAKNMIHNGDAECVIVNNGRIVAAEKGRGISPLLKLYDEQEKFMQNAVIVDKVIGRAAAFVTIKGGASEVYGKIMAEEAKNLLEQHDIKVSYMLLVPYIMNNQRNGLCPLEDSVKNISNPDDALIAMRKRIEELRKK